MTKPSEQAGNVKSASFLRPTLLLAVATLFAPSLASAQSVCLPAPRLLTTVPMGGQVGTTVEIVIAGEHLDDADTLTFSDPRLTAAMKVDAAGKIEPNKYVVSIAADCPPGLYEARVMTRLGMSSSRVFAVGTLPEAAVTTPNTTLATAKEIQVNSVCNAAMTARAIDHYQFEAKKGQRIGVECATRGIDSKLDAVVIIGDSAGHDLLVERRGGLLDFSVPEDGKYVVKVHELTFKGGRDCFYRLIVQDVPAGAAIARHPSTQPVNAFSWPPTGLPEQAPLAEAEPNNDPAHVQKITLPCDVSGSFALAADVDMFEFEAKKGEEWWVEVASERFGLQTDPNVLVQHVAVADGKETLTDVAEFTDIPSPVKVSSNGYAYDGPPFNAGSADILGKLTIQQDGLHRLQITDLFGGTRNDPRNVYRMVIRKAAPDFAVVAWPLHMELRNGDRNALTKPLALRNGGAMALEVVAIRRDGFSGEIDLVMENLPAGVRAQGLKIPAGQNRGILVVSAEQTAPRALASATFTGRATIDGAAVTHPCRLATYAWPIPDSWGEIPYPRLSVDIPVSVSGHDFAPLTIAPTTRDPIEAKAGTTLKIPLVQTRRSEFSGATMSLKTFGSGFEANAPFTVPLTADASEAVIDLAKLKTPPGDYQIAFYGSAVAKYRHHPEAVTAAELVKSKAEADLKAVDADLLKATEAAKAAAAEATKVEAAEAAKTAEAKMAADAAVVDLQAKQKAAAATLAAADQTLKNATTKAQPTDIVDIVVSEPIAIRVLPAETK
ncbi:serine protease [Planctomyces sp. SH-PL14]|uniref:serine protease n=1 Tax=Planctomyces sp. SH-PL14 TaxID=1632864 RepID=UPI00078CBC87|nr:serine protease [Planctomyces sp. SH-PL14]AMV18804.1 hypothetical protein VT03_12975 [Planctomyces sp. SH-PL14]